MRSLRLLALVAAATPAAAFGQSMAGMHMPGMTMPAPQTKKPPSTSSARNKPPAPARKAPAVHHHHDAGAMPGMDMGANPAPAPAPAPGNSMPGMAMPASSPAHAEHDMAAMPAMDHMPSTPRGTDLPAGNAPPPPVQHDRSADPFYGAAAMADAEARMMRAHGGTTQHQILFNLAEYQAHHGGDSYRWSGEAWVGGDVQRLVIKSEGEGGFNERLDSADVQALYSRAIDPYWNAQVGIRQAFLPGPDRPYAVLGIEGVAPYWFEVEGSLFLSSKGDLLGRGEVYYDQRLTQRLILQPRAELNFAAQDVRENRIGSGLSSAELGLRLRFEIRREFAPYVGMSWERRLGDTARLARAAGDDVESMHLVAGIRFWL